MYNDYGKLATEVYDYTKPTGCSLNGDIDYYEERLFGITGKILEAGVGTGRMLLPLLEQGFDMEGLDQSSHMLSVCKRHLEKQNYQVNLYEDNLTDFKIEQKYEAIIVPTATFCLIHEESEALQTLQNFYDHLADNGRLIIDLDLPFYPEVGEVTTSTFVLSPVNTITLEHKTVDINWLTQTITSHLKYEKWHKGQFVTAELQYFPLRWYGLQEFRLLLEKIGFKNISLSADYTYGAAPFDSNQTITFEATK